MKLKGAVSLSYVDIRYTKCIWHMSPNHLPYFVGIVSYMALWGRKQSAKEQPGEYIEEKLWCAVGTHISQLQNQDPKLLSLFPTVYCIILEIKLWMPAANQLCSMHLQLPCTQQRTLNCFQQCLKSQGKRIRFLVLCELIVFCLNLYQLQN